MELLWEFRSWEKDKNVQKITLMKQKFKEPRFYKPVYMFEKWQ